MGTSRISGARAVAGSWQLALAHGRFLVPPSSLLAPLGGQGPKLIRQLHVAPYRTFPGNASEAKGTRCLRASFADAIGNMREPVAAVAQIPTGSLAWFSGAHAGDAMPAGAGAMLALFARVRSSGLAAEPNVQNLFRCHFEQDAYFEIPQQLPPQYGFAAHEPVQVPRFSADGLLRWASHSDRGAAWRPVRKTPPAHLPCTCLHSPLQHMHMHMLRDLVPLAAHAHAHAHTRSLSVGRRARGVSRLRSRRQWRRRRRGTPSWRPPLRISGHSRTPPRLRASPLPAAAARTRTRRVGCSGRGSVSGKRRDDGKRWNRCSCELKHMLSLWCRVVGSSCSPQTTLVPH